MIWKKLKKVIVPLLILKLIIFIFFIFKSDLVTISRDLNYNTNYPVEFNNGNSIVKKEKLIRIVRNTETRGISIRLREKKNTSVLREKRDISAPLVD